MPVSQPVTDIPRIRRFCSNCKLDPGKECSPDADPVCCTDQGIAASTSVQCTMPDNSQGYCNSGVCSTFRCNIKVDGILRNAFCGLWHDNTCSAMCKGDDGSCIGIEWGSKETIANGAFCTTSTGARSTCASGICQPVCGDGVVQGAEECECPSGKKQCR